MQTFNSLCQQSKRCYEKLPPMKDQAIRSFVLSAGITTTVSLNLVTGMAGGAVAALASVIYSVAKPALENCMVFDLQKESTARTLASIASHFILSGGRTTLQQAIVFSIMSLASSILQDKNDQIFFNLLV